MIRPQEQKGRPQFATETAKQSTTAAGHTPHCGVFGWCPNSLYHGNFNDLLFEAARDPLFRRAWGIPLYGDRDDGVLPYDGSIDRSDGSSPVPIRKRPRLSLPLRIAFPI
jgi:hypothetical protein